MIPIGLRRFFEGRVQVALNPGPRLQDGSPNPSYTIERGDDLITIAYGPPRTKDLP